jgi:hypothetical protein
MASGLQLACWAAHSKSHKKRTLEGFRIIAFTLRPGDRRRLGVVARRDPIADGT